MCGMWSGQRLSGLPWSEWQDTVIQEADCSLCGQCITHCPVGALRARDDVDKVFEALADPEKITMVQIAPAVRTAWGEGIGLGNRGEYHWKIGHVRCAKMGFDYIFDTDLHSRSDDHGRRKRISGEIPE